MSLPVFSPPVNPDPCTKTRTTRLKTLNLGDGYSQESGDGINTRSDSLPLTWTDITTTEADAIEAFLEAVPEGGSFWWTAPRKSTPQKWKCPNWSRAYKNGQYDTITATFTEDFNCDD